MKSYPSISKTIHRDIEVYAYDKLDGSNIRAEWSPKQGFYKFGTRKRLLGTDDPVLGEAREFIQDGFSEHLSRVFKDQRAERGIAYFEFCGSNSFAGQHVNEAHHCSLIDVEVSKKGFIAPEMFEELFRTEVQCARLVYQGEITKNVEDDIRAGRMPNVTFEGVVCKAPPQKKWGLPVMFKIKSDSWISKVRSIYTDPRILEDLL